MYIVIIRTNDNTDSVFRGSFNKANTFFKKMVMQQKKSHTEIVLGREYEEMSTCLKRWHR